MKKKLKYSPEYNELAYKLALLNITDKEIAFTLGIAESTLYKWKVDYPDFSEALKKGKGPANGEVALSLYKRATGYNHKETKVFCYQGEVVTCEVMTHWPPDVGAIALFLKNRRPDLWKERHEIQATFQENTKKSELEHIAEKQGISVEQLIQLEGIELGDISE